MNVLSPLKTAMTNVDAAEEADIADDELMKDLEDNLSGFSKSDPDVPFVTPEQFANKKKEELSDTWSQCVERIQSNDAEITRLEEESKILDRLNSGLKASLKETGSEPDADGDTAIGEMFNKIVTQQAKGIKNNKAKIEINLQRLSAIDADNRIWSKLKASCESFLGIMEGGKDKPKAPAAVSKVATSKASK